MNLCRSTPLRPAPRRLSFPQCAKPIDWFATSKRVANAWAWFPPWGHLHAGHLSLVDRSNRDCDFTVVSIFVNPKQFNQPADYSVYPRTLESDLEQLGQRRVDLVFAPSVEEMYPAGFATHIDVEGVTGPWEGAARPGHFRGVTTVVMKLFQIIPADRAYFGRKDYQQVLAVQRMATDLNVPIEIVVCPLVRDHDGLALSSRNVHLSADERQSALVLSRGLRVARICSLAASAIPTSCAKRCCASSPTSRR